MKTLEEIDKKTPFCESDEYIASLVDKVTENAIAGKSTRTRFPFMKMAASIAIIFTLGGAGWMFLHNDSATQSQSPLDSFLCQITDEEAEQIMYYDIEELGVDNYNYELE